MPLTLSLVDQLVADEVLLAIALLLLAGTSSMLAFTIGHSAYMRWTRTRHRDRLRSLRTILAASVLGERSPPDAAERLAVATERMRIRIFVDLGRTVTGSSGRRLHETAVALGMVGRAEAECRARSWPRRLQAVRLLQIIGGGERAVPPLLDDPRPEVRRAAARWIAKHGTPIGIVHLLRAADRPGTLDPTTLVDTIDHAAQRHVRPLVHYLHHPGPGLVHVLRAAQGAAHGELAAPAMALVDHPSPAVRREVAGLLGTIGTDGTAERLRRLVVDPDPNVRESAVEALARIKDWGSASTVAGSLYDDEARVRRAAAQALRGYGSPGILLLMRAAKTDDERVRRTVQHVLDLPDTADFGGTT